MRFPLNVALLATAGWLTLACGSGPGAGTTGGTSGGESSGTVGSTSSGTALGTTSAARSTSASSGAVTGTTGTSTGRSSSTGAATTGAGPTTSGSTTGDSAAGTTTTSSSSGGRHHGSSTGGATATSTTTGGAATGAGPGTTTGAGPTSTGGSTGSSAGSTGTSGTSGGAYWQPGPDLDWQWEIGNPLSLSSAADMGTGVTAYNGDTSPGDNPTVYDIDAIINPASTVASLHTMGFHVICYIEVGTAGDYYSAADEGISTTYYAQLQAAGLFGNTLSGYPESFININSPQAVSIIESMIQAQCADKGFDGVETDLDETYNDNEGTTGFTITQADEETYMTTLANFMHSVGLAWVIKNPDDTGDSYASDMEPLAQLDLSEQCNQYSTCSLLSAFATDNKPVLNAEYSLATSAFCPQDNATTNINGRSFNVALNGASTPCR